MNPGEISYITSSLPPGSMKYQYTLLGRRVFYDALPLYVHDSVRSRPSLVIGSTGYGKTELLLSIAFHDIMKGRFTVFVDGKCDETTRNKLYYYACVAGERNGRKRKFYSVLPYEEGSHLGHSWNPFVTKNLSINKISELFINAYSPPTKEDSGDGMYYLELQRQVISILMRTLSTSGYAYNTQDIRLLLENEESLIRLKNFIRGEGHKHYQELISKIRKEGKKDFQRNMTRAVNYLAQFQNWSLNSYNPDVIIDELLGEDAVVYIGLPVNSEPYLMAKIGNIVINQLKSISAHVQTSESMARMPVSCIIDEAGSFVDAGLAEWICKVRSSGFMLMMGIQSLANLEGRRAGFAEEIRANSPNVMMFNPQDIATAEWFSKMSGYEISTRTSATLKEGKEVGDGSLSSVEQPRVPTDAILALRTGQFYYKGPIYLKKPPLVAATFLPDPPSRTDCKFKKQVYPYDPVRKGIDMEVQMDEIRDTLNID